MTRFVQGEGRSQAALLPALLDDYVGEDNPVRIVDAFVEQLDLRGLGFAGVDPKTTGQPSYRPPSCSSCTSTVTSTGFHPVAA